MDRDYLRVVETKLSWSEASHLFWSDRSTIFRPDSSEEMVTNLEPDQARCSWRATRGDAPLGCLRGSKGYELLRLEQLTTSDNKERAPSAISLTDTQVGVVSTVVYRLKWTGEIVMEPNYRLPSKFFDRA